MLEKTEKVNSLTEATPLEIRRRGRLAVASGNLSLTGFSLLEIIISMMLLALVLTSLGGVFVAIKRYLAHSRSRITAIQTSALYMEPLQNYVRQNDWDQSANMLSVNISNGPAVSFGGIEYRPNYNITNVSAGSFLRRATVAIRWNETE